MKLKLPHWFPCVQDWDLDHHLKGNKCVQRSKTLPLDAALLSWVQVPCIQAPMGINDHILQACPCDMSGLGVWCTAWLGCLSDHWHEEQHLTPLTLCSKEVVLGLVSQQGQSLFFTQNWLPISVFASHTSSITQRWLFLFPASQTTLSWTVCGLLLATSIQ